MLIHPHLYKICEFPSRLKQMDVDSYYKDKYVYLKNNGFFTKRKVVNLKSELDESIVRDNLSNTPQIVFEVTSGCNLNCFYCAQGELYESYNGKSSKNIDINSAVKLLKYFFDIFPCSKNNKLGIGFYGGEPLLNIKFIKQIIKVIPYLNAEKKLDVTFLMTTNGTLIHRHMDFLVENRFKLLISLDGNEENHSYRIFDGNLKNSHSKVIENVDMIKKQYPEYFEKNVSFNAVLHNRNSVKEIYEFVYMRYNKIPRIAELNMSHINPQKRGVLKNMFHNKRKSESEYIKENIGLLPHDQLSMYHELINFLKYISVNYYVSHITNVFHKEEINLPTSTCLPFSKKTFLTNDNKILTCERIGENFTLGTVKHEVLIDIPDITQQYNSYYEKVSKICRYCYAYRFCGLCMFQIEKFNNITNQRFVCDNFYDENKFKMKLFNIFSFLEDNPKDFFEILKNYVIEE